MKFVIRSLLFVNLLLQMTNSLRQCFNHDQNIMITIILLAFSVIGLIGLVIGNRFILIIFSASMTLILIASITIYAIGRTEEDSLKPKVPYYTSRASGNQETITAKQFRSSGESKRGYRLKSLVDKWLTNDTESNKLGKNESARARDRQRSPKTVRNSSAQYQRQRLEKQQLNIAFSRGKTWRDQRNRADSLPQPANTDELSDEPQVMRPEPIGPDVHVGNLSISGEASNSVDRDTRKSLAPDHTAKRIQWPVEATTSEGPNQDNVDDDENAAGEDKVQDQQWVAYESYLYEQYSNMVSQSIDLVLHTILAAWMALLLDDDSDQCFGPKTSRSSSLSGVGRAGSKAPPVYDYNGVRYSIRPDVDDSLAHIVVT